MLFLGLWATYATAQSGTFPNCTLSNFTWAFNEFQQSPCQVASALGQACTGTSFPIPALSSDENYLGPQVGFTNQCRCSSVFYNVLSACALCQGAEVSNWSVYDQNCSIVSVTVFPPAIPSGIAVPHWAYMDPTANGINTFNPQLAQADVGPESTAIPQSSSTSASGSTGTSTPAPHSGKKSNAGAIAGGVVGGIVAIILISVLIFFFLRRRRPAKSGSTSFDSDKLVNPEAAYPNSASMIMPSSTGTSAPAKFYDPNDPTTFPGQSAEPLMQGVYSTPSPAAHSQHFTPNTLTTNHTGATHYTNMGAVSQQNMHPGHAGYTGTAEVM